MSLANLPTELLQLIASFCGPGPDLGALARANTRLHHIANPILWRLGIDDPAYLTKMTARAAEAGNLHTLKKAASFGANLDLIHPVPLPDETLVEFCDAWLEEQYSDMLWGAPLHLAVYHGFHEMVKWLISQDVDIEAPGRLLCHCKGIQDYEDGSLYIEDVPCWTSLHFAICQSHDATARLLLREGASTKTMIDIDDIDFEGRVNQSHGQVDYVRRFSSMSMARRVTALHTASEMGQRSLVEHLVQDCQVDINETDDSGHTPIFYAMLSSDQGMIAHLASLGADLDYGYETPLQWALVKGFYKSVRPLLEQGASTWRGEPKSSLIRCQEVFDSAEFGNWEPGPPFFSGHWNSNQLQHCTSQERANALVEVLRHALMSYQSDEHEYNPVQSEIGSAIVAFIEDKHVKIKHIKQILDYLSQFDEIDVVAPAFQKLIRSVRGWSFQPNKIRFLLRLGAYPRNGDISPLYDLAMTLRDDLKDLWYYMSYQRNPERISNFSRKVDLVTDMIDHEQWNSVSKTDMVLVRDVCVEILGRDWGRFRFLREQLRDSLVENLPQEFLHCFTDE